MQRARASIARVFVFSGRIAAASALLVWPAMNERGFTLLDALIASVILMSGISALAQVFVVASRTATAARQVTEATTLAAQTIEELRSLAWGTAAGGSDRVAEYARTWSVEPLETNPDDAIVIDVRVTPGGVRLTTLRARWAP